jgi:hypothetical protein
VFVDGFAGGRWFSETGGYAHAPVIEDADYIASLALRWRRPTFLYRGRPRHDHC